MNRRNFLKNLGSATYEATKAQVPTTPKIIQKVREIDDFTTKSKKYDNFAENINSGLEKSISRRQFLKNAAKPAARAAINTIESGAKGAAYLIEGSLIPNQQTMKPIASLADKFREAVRYIKFQNKNIKHFANFTDETQPITLQEHQQRVADKLANQRGLIAYHGLGSGKTITGINAAEKYGTNGTVVVTPAKLQDNFRKELKTYGAKGKYDIYSYEKFLRDNPDTTNKFLLVDEAHKLRNSNTARSQGLLSASRKANKTLLLSGTPIQNNASDIAPLINIASGEDLLPSGRAFIDTYTEKKTTKPNFIDRTFKGARPITAVQPKNLEDYYNKSKRYVDYYSPEDRSNYPTVNEQRVDVDLDPNQLKLYKQTYSQLPSKVRNILNSGGQEPATEKDAQQLNTFLNLNRQASNTARKYYRAGEKQYDSKSSRILQNIAENKYKKSLIYSNYLDSGLEDVKQRLSTDPNIKYGEIRGDIKPEDQRRILDDYNNDRLNTLLVSSAGGEGLDLKGTRGVHILEPHFNDEKINQVIGRAARYKSHANLPEEDRNVQVYKYQSKFPKNWLGQEDKRPTADQYLYNLSERKSDLNNKFLEGFRNQ